MEIVDEQEQYCIGMEVSREEFYEGSGTQLQVAAVQPMSYAQAIVQNTIANEDDEARKRLSELKTIVVNKILKQNTKWGPTHCTRQNTRVKAHVHTIMEQAQGNKMK
jgi:hypothetical protein